MLEHITPVLLTYNEAPNIARTLSKLTWADDIVVLDSGSTDETLSILRRFPRVRVFKRPFDTHGNQWRHAVFETNIKTPWILRLDADYQVTEALVEEMSRLDHNDAPNAYRISFDYAIFSHKLLASLYPPNTVLLRMGYFTVSQSGHTETWTVKAPIGALKAHIIHDDWKPVEDWLESQARYMRRELNELPTKRGKVRKFLRRRPPLMPLLTFFYCLIGKGLIFNGRAGVAYTLQSLVAESILSLMVLEKRLRDEIEGKAGESQR
jgi:glycosyltransferase involved in cell wall biosynthesis